MFNYVVKDPNSSRLSGELWIKEQTGLSHRSCVLELASSQLRPNYWKSQWLGFAAYQLAARVTLGLGISYPA